MGTNILAGRVEEMHDVAFSHSHEKGSVMPEIFVEKQGEGKWHAIRNSTTIATGTTQNECGCNARKKYPNDTLLTGRIERTNRGNPDHWRRFYPKC
jgi:hypothetical protein